MGFTQAEVDRHNAKIAAAKAGKSGIVATDHKPYDGQEGDIHDKIEEELHRRRWYYVHSRRDKKTTNQLGVTDFIIAKPDGVTLWVECKRKGAKLDVDQNIAKHCLLALGHRHFVVYSFEEFLEAIK